MPSSKQVSPELVARNAELDRLYREWLTDDAKREPFFAAVVSLCNDLAGQFKRQHPACQTPLDDLAADAYTKALPTLTQRRSDAKPIKSVAGFIATIAKRAMVDCSDADTLVVVAAPRTLQKARQDGEPKPTLKRQSDIKAEQLTEPCERDALHEEILSLCKTPDEELYVKAIAELEDCDTENMTDESRMAALNLLRAQTPDKPPIALKTVNDLRNRLKRRIMPWIDFVSEVGPAGPVRPKEPLRGTPEWHEWRKQNQALAV